MRTQNSRASAAPALYSSLCPIRLRVMVSPLLIGSAGPGHHSLTLGLLLGDQALQDLRSLFLVGLNIFVQEHLANMTPWELPR